MAWQGQLQLEYELSGAQTIVKSAYNKAPLRIQRPFYPEAPKICHSVIVHTAGGVVGGDRLNLDIGLGAKTHALITTAAAAKIYGENSQLASQAIHLRLSAQTVLEWFPQETIVYRGAQYRQDLRVELESGACWVGMDLVRFGRTARGEQFDSGEWRSHSEVWQAGSPLWIDRAFLAGNEANIKSPTTLSGYSVIGTFVCLGHPIEKDVVVQIQNHCLPSERNDFQMGITKLSAGILCRYRGHSTEQARDYYLKVWKTLRLIYADCGICIPRVWQCFVP